MKPKPRAQALKWRALSLVTRTIGRTSDAVSLGFRQGFDSGEMLDYVYENRARGRWLIGKLVDRIYLDAIGWRAVRARKEVLKVLLAGLVQERQRRDLATTVLDIASGPGRYLHEVCQDLGSRADGVTVICRDLDQSGLERGRGLASSLGLANFRYERGDACDPGSLRRVTPQPDIAIASGLYELLDEPSIRSSMEGVYTLLPPGGRFVFTTQVSHPQLEMIANVLVNRDGEPWVMVCRSLEETERWATECGFEVLSSRLESIGLFGVTVCAKSGA